MVTSLSTDQEFMGLIPGYVVEYFLSDGELFHDMFELFAYTLSVLSLEEILVIC